MKKQIKKERRGFPGSPAVKTPSSQCRGAWVQSLVRELESIMPQQKIPVPQLRPGAAKLRILKKRQREIGGPGSKREVKESHDDQLPEVP